MRIVRFQLAFTPLFLFAGNATIHDKRKDKAPLNQEDVLFMYRCFYIKM